jgi:hypothetical protein
VVEEDVDPFAGGFPTPPLPWQRMIRTDGPAVAGGAPGGGEPLPVTAGGGWAERSGGGTDEIDEEAHGG